MIFMTGMIVLLWIIVVIMKIENTLNHPTWLIKQENLQL